MSPSLPAATAITSVSLRVADLSRSLMFYRDLLGFDVAETGPAAASLTVDGFSLILLRAQAGLPRRPRNAPGLFHVAILLPDRPALGAVLARLAGKGLQPGASDHIVSEALYIDDPDGNGLEICADRPREGWQWHDGEIRMATQPMNVREVLAQAASVREPYRLPKGTRIGHIHLQVGDLDEARRFYVDTLGFDVTTESYPGALFVSAGGYHHHIGLNIWRSRGGRAAPADRAGLDTLRINLPQEGLEALHQRLDRAGVEVEDAPSGVYVRDPWQNRILLTAS